MKTLLIVRRIFAKRKKSAILLMIEIVLSLIILMGIISKIIYLQETKNIASLQYIPSAVIRIGIKTASGGDFENHRFIDTVYKFRPENFFHFSENSFSVKIVLSGFVKKSKTEAVAFSYIFGSDV